MIGMNIKQLRQEKHIKQDTLADAIGVSAQAVSKWETGASDPDVALLPRLATYFGVSIDELFETPRAEKMERIQNMIWDERRISPETFDRTVAYLEGILKEDPKDAETLTMLSELYNHRAHADHENASYYAERVLEADPDDEHNAWAAYLEANNAPCGDNWLDNHFAVIRFIRTFVENHPFDRYAKIILAENLLADHRLGEAEATIASMKKDDAYLDYSAKLAFLKGDREEALRLWKKAAAEYPQRWQATDSLGEGYLALGMYREALDAFEKSFTMQSAPRYTDGLFARAQVHEEIGDYEGAIEDRKRIIDCLKTEYNVTDGESVDENLREIERLKALIAKRK
ncbi:MAG: helix-turn-helix domain-containing protein [Clostridia bacterium]|nr:helix-turn-helix domain-containing protein [Clostridia bacterium]